MHPVTIVHLKFVKLMTSFPEVYEDIEACWCALIIQKTCFVSLI